MGAEEIKAKVERLGPEATLHDLEQLRTELDGWNPEDGGEAESTDEWRGRMMAKAKVSSVS